MIYGYARVSTRNQEDNGNSLDEQVNTLRSNGAEVIYSEAFTGTTTNRPKFNELLNILQEGDTLIVTKLDRFARSIVEGYETIEELINRGVRVNILNIGVMDNTPCSKAIRGLFLTFAQFERDMIVQRTSEGRKVAKANGVKFGRKKTLTKKQIEYALSLLIVNGGTKSYTEVAEIMGISRITVIRYNREYKAEQNKAI